MRYFPCGARNRAFFHILSVDIDLATGAISNLDGIVTASAVARGDGWWRLLLTATAGFADLLNRRFCGYGP